MNPRHIVSLAVSAGLLAGSVSAASAQLQLPRVSPKATVTQTIGITDLSLTYSRPGVKNRVIWGGLVPYDQPWRTGANEANVFVTSDDIQVGGQTLAAGSYSLFTIPTANDWTVIWSKQTDLWGAYEYDPSQDALRLTVKPTTGEHVEWMRFTFDNLTPNSAELVLAWEKLRLTVPIAVDVNAVVLPKMRAAVAEAKADDWRVPYRAASYCFDAGVNLDEAHQWLERSVTTEAAYPNLFLKARWQAKHGKTKDAVKTAKMAIEKAKAADPPADTAAMEKQMAEWVAAK